MSIIIRASRSLGKESEFNTLKLQFATKRANLDQEAKNERMRAKTSEQASKLDRLPTRAVCKRRCGGAISLAEAGAEVSSRRWKRTSKRTISSDAEVQEQILKELKPEPRPEGKTAYRFRDGGVLVVGSDRRLSPLSECRRFAVIFALNLDVAATPNRPMPLTGDPDSQKMMVMAAAAYAIPNVFADPALEKDRQRLRSLAEGDPNFAAALTYVVEHQASVARRDGYFPCLVWEPEYAGPATLERLVTLQERCQSGGLAPRDHPDGEALR